MATSSNGKCPFMVIATKCILTIVVAIPDSSKHGKGPVKQKKKKHKKTPKNCYFFKYPRHMFWLRNKKNNFQVRTLIWGPEFALFTLMDFIHAYF